MDSDLSLLVVLAFGYLVFIEKSKVFVRSVYFSKWNIFVPFLICYHDHKNRKAESRSNIQLETRYVKGVTIILTVNIVRCTVELLNMYGSSKNRYQFDPVLGKSVSNLY